MKRHGIWEIVFSLALLVPLVALLLSCGIGGGGGDSSSGTAGASTGSVAVVLADGPAEYKQINVWITEVSLIPATGSASPVTIFKTNKFEEGHIGLMVDLLEFRDEDFVMTVKKGVPTGKYAKIRLGISAIETVGGPCDLLRIKLPSGRIDLNPREPFLVMNGGNLSIRLDIDADKSINLHEAGNSGKCIFRPVVFVDIEEGAPVGRCPKIVQGEIIQLIKSGTVTEGVVIALDRGRGELRVELTEDTVIFDEEGVFSDAGALKIGQEVKVRGMLDDRGVLVATLVVIGDLLDITGLVESEVDSANIFQFAPFPGQEFLDRVDVRVMSQTVILLDCNTYGSADLIVPGMKARVFGKYGSEVLSAAAIILQDREIKGTITKLEEQDEGLLATIDEFGVGPVQVFILLDTPVSLVGGRKLSVDDLCTGQEVRVVLEPSAADSLTAKAVFVRPEKHVGEIIGIDGKERTLVVDEDRDLQTKDDQLIITVPLGAKILKSEEDDGEQKEFLSFDDLEVKDFIVYFGLPACGEDSTFIAFEIVVADEYNDDEGNGGDYNHDDYLPRFVLDNNVHIRLREGGFSESLTVRGNNFQLFGQVGPNACANNGWTVVEGDVEVYGNNAKFRNTKFLGRVWVPGNEVEFINCCFEGGDPIYSK